MRALAFRSREKFDNSFCFKFFWSDLIASPISFNFRGLDICSLNRARYMGDTHEGAR